MNNDNDYDILGLSSDGDNLFDFEAASSTTLCAGTPNNPAQQRQIVQAEEMIHIMPLTKSEIEAILAARASNAQNCHHAYNLAPPEPNANFSRFEGPSFSYDGADSLLPTHFNDVGIPDHSNATPSVLDGFGTFEEPRFEQAELFGALTDCAPNDATDQSDLFRSQQMKEAVNNDVSNMAAFSPIQTEGSIRQSEHLKSALRAWSLGGKCTWPECNSKAIFKTKASFNMHVTNMHTRPLLCFVANCSQKTPFGRLSDLRRHRLSTHSAERKFVCRVPSCNAKIKEFARKDHLAKHMRERHDHYFCPLNHCPRGTKSSFDKPENVAQHIKDEHWYYECALKGCAQAPLSEFSRRSLQEHLRNHHGMPDITAIYVSDRMVERISKRVIEIDLGRANCSDCKICEKRTWSPRSRHGSN